MISVIFFLNCVSSQCFMTENKIADWVYFFVSKQEADLTTEYPPHGKNVLVSQRSYGPWCGVCMFSLWLCRFTPVQNHMVDWEHKIACQLVTGACVCACVSACVFVSRVCSLPLASDSWDRLQHVMWGWIGLSWSSQKIILQLNTNNCSMFWAELQKLPESSTEFGKNTRKPFYEGLHRKSVISEQLKSNRTLTFGLKNQDTSKIHIF